MIRIGLLGLRYAALSTFHYAVERGKSMIEVVGMQERMWALHRKRQVAAFEKLNGLIRPASAYVLFMTDKRKEGARIEGSGPSGGVTSKDISKIWNKMPVSERQPWIQKFEKMQDVFKTQKANLENTDKYKKFIDDLDTNGRLKWQNEQQSTKYPGKRRSRKTAPVQVSSSSDTETEESSDESESESSADEVDNGHSGELHANGLPDSNVVEKEWSKIRAQKVRDYMKAADDVQFPGFSCRILLRGELVRSQ